MSDQSYMALMAVIALTLALMALFTMEGCSGDMTRTRMDGKADLVPPPADFCAKHPDDIACRGPKK